MCFRFFIVDYGIGLDWFIQFINVLQSNNTRRLITGFSGGMGITYIYYYLFIYIIELINWKNGNI